MPCPRPRNAPLGPAYLCQQGLHLLQQQLALEGGADARDVSRRQVDPPRQLSHLVGRIWAGTAGVRSDAWTVRGRLKPTRAQASQQELPGLTPSPGCDMPDDLRRYGRVGACASAAPHPGLLVPGSSTGPRLTPPVADSAHTPSTCAQPPGRRAASPPHRYCSLSSARSSSWSALYPPCRAEQSSGRRKLSSSTRHRATLQTQCAASGAKQRRKRTPRLRLVCSACSRRARGAPRARLCECFGRVLLPLLAGVAQRLAPLRQLGKVPGAHIDRHKRPHRACRGRTRAAFCAPGRCRRPGPAVTRRSG